MADDFVQRGKELLVRRDFMEVVRVCRLGLLSKPALMDGRLLLGTALLKLRRYDEVLAEMQVAQDLDADNVLVHLLRGEALLRKGEPEQAMEVLGRAVELDGKNGLARKLFAEARVRAGIELLTGPEKVIAEPMAPEPEAQGETESPPAASAEADAVPGEPVAETAPIPRTARRRSWPRWLPFAAAGVALLAAAGVVAFFVVSSSRAAAERHSRLRVAAAAAAQQTYRGMLRAIDLYGRAAADGDAQAEAPLARLRAALVFEQGVRLPGDVKVPGGRDGQVVALYQELAAGAGPDTARQAQALEGAYPDDAEVAYISGRARGDAVSLRRSIEIAPSPLAWVSLAELEAGAGHLDAALTALDAVSKLVPDHPAAAIVRAQVLAAAGRLPPAADGEPEGTLARLLAGDPPPLSPAQQRLATLALAQVKLARGDAAGAKAALASRPDLAQDPLAGELAVEAELAAGDVAAARALVERWRKDLPAAAAPKAWQARVAVAEDNLEAARAALAEAGEGEASFAALEARGEVALAAGDLDGATAELEKAIALRPGDRSAQLARARVDLERNDGAAVEARLAPLHDAVPDPYVAAFLGEAVRRRGDRAKARALLEEASQKLEAASGRPSVVAATALALARLDHDDGRYADAAHEAARVLAIRPQDLDARLLAAQVRFDLADAAAARTDIDTLVVAAHTSAPVLMLAARIHEDTHDHAGAHQLLDQAAALPQAPASDIVRENARLVLAEGGARQAVTLLTAGGRWPEDGESWMILVEALIAAAERNDFSAADPVVAEVARRFDGKAEEALAQGRLQLARNQAVDAAASFQTALAREVAAAAPPREQAVVRVLLGQALEAAGKPDEALAAYRDAAGAAGRAHTGRLLAAKGDAAGAFEALGEAVKLDATRADAWCAYGEVAAELKKPAVARPALETCIKLAGRGAMAERAQKTLGGL